MNDEHDDRTEALRRPGEHDSTIGLDQTASSSRSAPPMVADRDRVHRQIGDGGMGEVWEAEQLEPVRRRVALKVIKQGMDTREVVARFSSERQALALMDHSNIAKVLDAGVTDRGRRRWAARSASSEWSRSGTAIPAWGWKPSKRPTRS